MAGNKMSGQFDLVSQFGINGTMLVRSCSLVNRTRKTIWKKQYTWEEATILKRSELSFGSQVIFVCLSNHPIDLFSEMNMMNPSSNISSGTGTTIAQKIKQHFDENHKPCLGRSPSPCRAKVNKANSTMVADFSIGIPSWEFSIGFSSHLWLPEGISNKHKERCWYKPDELVYNFMTCKHWDSISKHAG